ncbi:hypothetical protein CERSUDRAFT_81326 [Gelatoporia subvermispora B]|uniref:Uncharacterized protein n=1 Tax=Ceriporiopsis subvermispora (strain B) TaxID=914234 RepID=M2QSL3_CERS8|nr:hypothetical protein CERSUDRAFT_81326 [Gelatoporia subvermispora B]
MNSFTKTLFCFLLSLFALAAAAPVIRDVFVPPVTYPHQGTVWYVGQYHNVTWETAGAPVNITNKIGRVVLAKGGIEDINNPLATNFSILDGRVVVKVPDVEPGNDYAIVLFGDSGNFSPNFTIKA